MAFISAMVLGLKLATYQAAGGAELLFAAHVIEAQNQVHVVVGCFAHLTIIHIRQRHVTYALACRVNTPVDAWPFSSIETISTRHAEGGRHDAENSGRVFAQRIMQPALSFEESLHWLALRMVAGLGTRKAGQLIEIFRTPQAIFRASRSELEAAGCRRRWPRASPAAAPLKKR